MTPSQRAETPQWIDIKDEHPEYMQVVLIVVEQLNFVIEAQYGGDGNIFTSGSEIFRATHWMPMPLPPP